MKRKNFLVFSIFIFLFCVLGCGDEGLETVLHDLGAAPAAEGVVTEVPPEIKEIIWGRDVDALMAELKDVLDDGFYTNKDGRLVHDSANVAPPRLIRQICFRREQEAYYNKYISAGGIAIMGNRYIEDRFFYAARDIALGMTSKRPELRALLSPSRENRPGTTEDGFRNAVSGRYTISREFRIILKHVYHSFALLPEVRLKTTVAPIYPQPSGIGGFFATYAFVTVQDRYLQGVKSIAMHAIFSHEFAHAIHYAIRLLDPTFDDRLEAAYASAIENGSYFGDSPRYSDLRNAREYWAGSASKWCGKFAGSTKEFYHDKFREKDPLMYALLDEWLPLIDLRTVETKVYE